MSELKVKCPHCSFEWKMISPEKLSRSNPQNRYFHGVIVPIISGHTGYTLEETKNMLKGMFLKDEFFVKTVNGMKEISIVKDTRELKTDEFERFTAECRMWAATELQCNVPEPNEGAI